MERSLLLLGVESEWSYFKKGQLGFFCQLYIGKQEVPNDCVVPIQCVRRCKEREDGQPRLECGERNGGPAPQQNTTMIAFQPLCESNVKRMAFGKVALAVA